MTNKNSRLVLGFILIVCACFITCNFENPIMETWWAEPERGHYYTVTFETNGGIPIPGDQKIAKNGKVGKVLPMSRGEDGFGGWYKDASCGDGNGWNFAEDIVTADIKLFAKWVEVPHPTIYEVTFDSNGGNPKPEKQLIVRGAKVVEPTALRRAASGPNSWDGFGGWYKDDVSFTEQWNFANDTVTESMTLYAKWQPPPPASPPVTPPAPPPPPPPEPIPPSPVPHYYVTFEANGGTPEPRSQDLIQGAKIVEPLAVNRDGYGFGGWFTDPTLTQQWNFAEDTVGKSSGSIYITLYAKWVTTYYTVTFNSNGGVPAPQDQSVAQNTKVIKPSPMRNPGYGFAGWFTDEGNEWNFDNPVTQDMTLTARWGEEKFTIIFTSAFEDPHGGDSPGGHGNYLPPNQVIPPGAKIIEPPDISRAGYCFAGWYTRKTGGVPWNFDDAVNDNTPGIVAGSDDTLILTLYAYWVIEIEGMAWVKRGRFIMGDDHVTGAKPAHEVTLDGFYMSKYLVTQKDYEAVTGLKPSHFNTSGDNAPVDGVSWYDAVNYCNERGISEGLGTDRVYNITNSSSTPSSANGITATTITNAAVTAGFTRKGYRLPTEAEWEYAARGGNGSPGSYIYSGSDNPDDVGWYNVNSGSMTRSVGTKQPNGLGIYDMSGNITEWCWDWYDPKYYDTYGVNSWPANPLGPSSSPTGERVRRGGSWNNAYGNLRTTIRNSFEPGGTSDTKKFWTLGFRVVRSETPQYYDVP